MQRPWNLPSLPVYSLATRDGLRVNMNICTYVTAVSMKPKVMAVALYRDTKTLENMLNSDTAVLQLLGEQQYNLVRVLGKKSGSVVDKQAWLHKNHHTTSWKGHEVLKDCAAYMELEKMQSLPTGDHTLFLFKVQKYVTQHDALLTTQILGDKKIISI